MKQGLYFIGILPPHNIRELVETIKTEFTEKYDSKEAYRRLAHFTLQPPFKIPQEHEPGLIRSLTLFA